MSSTGTDYTPHLQILPTEDSIWKSPHNIYEMKCLPLPLHDSTHCVNMYYCQTRYIYFCNDKHVLLVMKNVGCDSQISWKYLHQSPCRDKLQTWVQISSQ